MDTDRWLRIKELFQEALHQGPEERGACLEEACGDDVELRAEVAALLTSHEESTGFMEIPTGVGLLDEAPQRDLTATRLGHYFIEEVISAGGMGTVYRAVQEKPHRTVAIKVMRVGIASRSALRRFEFEAEILGRFSHPHVAQIIEAGTYLDEGGVPYFVMEYVEEAKSITEYARARGLCKTERLELILQACDAVHYGHQKGIIHRDLKPNNILVSARGDVKVIDFGVARATDLDVTLTTARTDIGQLLGTLQYMSPEQCKADPNDLDIRSDVYALGVVLYELLCGELPYDVRQVALFEATHIIREVEPRRPSTVIPGLRGDVQTIVLKALEKDRARRYQSVMELGADLRRHLAGELILARPASSAARTAKWVRHHLVFSASAGVALAAALIFVGYVLLVSLPRIRQERNIAEAQRKRAVEAEREALEAQAATEQEADNTLAINTFLEEMLSSADPFVAGEEVRVRDMLDAAAARIDREFPDRPVIEASLRHTLGVTFYKNGRYDAAGEQLEKSIEILLEALGSEAEGTLTSSCWLGVVRMGQGRLAEAETLLTESLQTATRVFGETHPVTLQAMNNVATLRIDQGRYGEAEVALRKVIEIGRRDLTTEHWLTLSAMYTLANVAIVMSNTAEAEALLEEVLEIQTRTLGEEHPNTLNTKTSLASAYLDRGQYAKAETIYTTVLASYRHLLPNNHPYTLGLMTNLANLYVHQARLSEAEVMHREVLQARTSVLSETHPETLQSMNNLAYVLKKKGVFDESEVLLQAGLDIARKALPADHGLVALFRMNLGECLVKLERFEEAEGLLLESQRALKASLGAGHWRTRFSIERLIELYEAWGDPEQAGAWRQRL